MEYHNNIKYNKGDTLKVKTFAGPEIYTKVKKIVNYKSSIGGEEVHVIGFEGALVRRKDLISLKKACVPYSGNEKLSKCISFTYDYQIIKVIKRG